MQENDDVTHKIEVLRDLMEKHMGIKSTTFAKAAKKAGRRLPRALRKKAATVSEAESYASHPKLMRRIDRVGFNLAFDDLQAHLKQFDLADQKWGRFLNILAGVALNFLIVVVLVIVYLRWREII